MSPRNEPHRRHQQRDDHMKALDKPLTE
jgi:hypothetical protein